MTGLYPFIEASIGGKPVSDMFYQRLVKATIHDAPGQDADSCELTFDDTDNAVEIPATDDEIDIEFGFRDEGYARSKAGRFVVEKPRIEGGEGGEFVIVSGRSAKMAPDVKEPLSEHFQDTTVGAVVSELAGRHGYQARVDGAFASQPIEYMARVNQSTYDFLSRLADRYGALFAPKGGQYLFLQRGRMPAITIDKSECESWQFEVEPRPRYGKVEAGWFERSSGRTIFETHSTGLKGPIKRLRTTYPSKAVATAAAKGEGERLGRATGSGSITMAGRPEIMADIPIITRGWRPEANGLWRCSGVDHTFDSTYMTTAELEAPEAGKAL